ncbi:hypothetical protein AAF712_016195, partial [Marasmius tenuissimus]
MNPNNTIPNNTNANTVVYQRFLSLLEESPRSLVEGWGYLGPLGFDALLEGCEISMQENFRSDFKENVVDRFPKEVVCRILTFFKIRDILELCLEDAFTFNFCINPINDVAIWKALRVDLCCPPPPRGMKERDWVILLVTAKRGECDECGNDTYPEIVYSKRRVLCTPCIAGVRERTASEPQDSDDYEDSDDKLKYGYWFES